MPYLKCYEEEAERWPQLSYPNGRCSSEEAEVVVRKLTRHFRLPSALTVYWTSGRNYSRAFYRAVVLNVDHLNYRIVAHEFAHSWASQGGYQGKWEKQKRPHGRLHRKLTDRVCRYIIKQGWHEGVLAHGLAVVGLRRKEAERAAAQPPPLDARIAKRQEQVKRLERKVKALTTRLKRAKRSLSALERRAAKA